MRFLVTGTSGFLGRRVLEGLVRQPSTEVVTLHRTAPADPPPGTVPVIADLADRAALERAAAATGPVDAIVHLAARVPRTVADDVAGPTYETNVQGTINLLDAWATGSPHVVLASTTEVYGLPTGTGPIDESHPPRPPTFYAASKLAAEELVRVASARRSTAATILRFTVLYGAGDEIDRAIPNFIKRALRAEDLELYGGEELRDYLHVDDAAEAVLRAVEHRPAGTFNIGSGHTTSVRDAAEIVVAMVGTQAAVRVLPRRKAAADLVLDTSRARAELGFEARHVFPQLLEDQIAWHRSNP